MVHAWDKDAVRVQARTNTRTKVDVRTASNAINIEAVATNGPTGSVDYEITAPAWMSMKVEGQYNFVTIEGIQGDVSIETVRGDIVMKSGRSGDRQDDRRGNPGRRRARQAHAQLSQPRHQD